MRDRSAIALLFPVLAFACAAAPPSTDLEKRIVTVAEKVTPSVVHIQAIVKFDDRRSEVTGSGLIVS